MLTLLTKQTDNEKSLADRVLDEAIEEALIRRAERKEQENGDNRDQQAL